MKYNLKTLNPKRMSFLNLNGVVLDYYFFFLTSRKFIFVQYFLITLQWHCEAACSSQVELQKLEHSCFRSRLSSKSREPQQCPSLVNNTAIRTLMCYSVCHLLQIWTKNKLGRLASPDRPHCWETVETFQYSLTALFPHVCLYSPATGMNSGVARNIDFVTSAVVYTHCK